MLYNPSIHFFGSKIGTPDGHDPFLSLYTCNKKSRKFSMSTTSWSKYLNVSTHPNMMRRIMTPSGMCGSVNVASFYLCIDICTVYFPLVFPFIVDGPCSWCASFSASTSESFCFVTSST
jgi:hypothetical protein